MPYYYKGGKKYRKKGRKRYYKRKWLKAFTKSTLTKSLAYGKSSGEVNIMCQTRQICNIVVPSNQTLSSSIVTVCPGFSHMLGNGEVKGVQNGLAGAFDDANARKMFATYDMWRVRGVYLSVRLGGFLNEGEWSYTTAESVRPYCYWDRSAQYSTVFASNVNSTDIKQLSGGSGGIPFTKSADKYYSFKCLPKNASEATGWLTTQVLTGSGYAQSWISGLNMKYSAVYCKDYLAPGIVGQCVFLPCASLVFDCSTTASDERELQVVVEAKYFLSFRNPGAVNKSSSECEFLLKSNDDLKPIPQV